MVKLQVRACVTCKRLYAQLDHSCHDIHGERFLRCKNHICLLVLTS